MHDLKERLLYAVHTGKGLSQVAAEAAAALEARDKEIERLETDLADVVKDRDAYHAMATGNIKVSLGDCSPKVKAVIAAARAYIRAKNVPWEVVRELKRDFKDTLTALDEKP